MPLNLVQRRGNRAVAILLAGSCLALVAIYIAFDFYLASIGREIVSGWAQAETVAIQEGQLLHSISKNQRILMSSQFVQGVALFDFADSDRSRLIELGERIEAPSEIPSGEIGTLDVGFLHKRVTYSIPGSPFLVVIFDIKSSFLQTGFFAALLLCVFFVGLIVSSARAIEKKEASKRESYLRDALDELVGDGHSVRLESEFPRLSRWWLERQEEIRSSRQNSMENERKILLGEVAARIAHDIRSPVGTLKAALETLKDVPKDTHRLLTGAIESIEAIADSVRELNRPMRQPNVPLVKEKPTATLLIPLFESIIEEKRLQLRGRRTLQFDEAKMDFIPVVMVQPLELKRSLANLLDNAIEATEDGGEIGIFVKEDGSLITIKIVDEGCGIRPDLLAKVGEKGFSHGKANGTGLGFHYARKAAESWGGCLQIASRLDKGTQVEMTLPLRHDRFLTNLTLERGAKIVIVDDETFAHDGLRSRLTALDPSFEIEHFFAPKDALTWVSERRADLGDFYLFSDLHMNCSDFDGLDVLREVGPSKRTFLMTNAFDHADVQDRCRDLGVSILPKTILSQIPIVQS